MISTRGAQLGDTGPIVALFCAQIPAWQRLDSSGRVVDIPYSELGLYDRWLHGGPWMSIETAAIFLNHLLLGAGLPLVALSEDGRVIGYAELYPHHEGDGYGSHAHLAHLITHDEAARGALLDTAFTYLRTLKLPRLLVTTPGDAALPSGVETRPVASLARYSISPRSGQVFYQMTDLVSADAAQITGWSMPAGRITSARHQWETLMPRLFETLPELASQPHARLKLSAGGLDAIVYVAARQYDPRSADVAIWTPKGLQPQIITALRDWAVREGYRKLWLTVPASAYIALGPDAEADGFRCEALEVVPPAGA